MNKERVCFFSEHDGSIPFYCDRMEEVVKSYEEGGQPKDAADYLEMFHILQFVEHKKYPSSWTETRLDGIRQYREKIARFFTQQSSGDFLGFYESLDYDYRSTLWQIVDTFRIKNVINQELLQHLVDKEPYCLRNFLKHEWIVNHNALILTKLLKTNPNTAEWLLEQYVEDESFGERQRFYFPSSFTGADKDIVVRDYINSPNANLNYVSLVLVAKRSKDFPISPLALKCARIREKELNDEVLKHGSVHVAEYGVELTSKETAPVKEFKIDENGWSVLVYNRNLIEACTDPSIVYYCALVFEFVTKQGFISKISKPSDMGALERAIGLHAKNAYPIFSAFNVTANITLLQMKVLETVLEGGGRTIEGVIKAFYEDFLKKEYGYEGLSLTLPSGGHELVSKIRNMAIEMDSVAHQYNCYVENGVVDNDLIELTSPQGLQDTRSLIQRRYCVPNREDKDINHLFHLLFSDQCMLSYVEPCREMHLENFYSLLAKGIEVNYNDYRDYQKVDVNYLMAKGYLSKDDKGILRCDKMSEINILKHLYDYGACGYFVYSPSCRGFLDEMVAKGQASFDNHLLTPAERDYFSYYLDNKKFTNGPAIRNNYAHGTTPSYSNGKHQENYLQLQVLFIMLLLKLSEDLGMKRFLDEKGKR